MPWQYTATGGLVAYDPPEDMDWHDNEMDKDYHARIGYEESFDEAVRDEMLSGGFQTVVAKDDQAAYHYIVYVNIPHCHVETVWIPTFPDWLAFFAQYAPAAAGYALQTNLREIHELLEKCFQAWHGHDALECCHACDPRGWERQMERRRRARAKEQKT